LNASERCVFGAIPLRATLYLKSPKIGFLNTISVDVSEIIKGLKLTLNSLDS